jgi:hypothetical protein
VLVNDNPFSDPIVVADNWASLTYSDSAVLRSAINRTEFGEQLSPDSSGSLDMGANDPGPTSVWTNVLPSGMTKFRNTCLGAMEGDSHPAAFGDSAQLDSRWTVSASAQTASEISAPTMTCRDTTVARFYCMEQDR